MKEFTVLQVDTVVYGYKVKAKSESEAIRLVEMEGKGERYPEIDQTVDRHYQTEEI